MQVARAFQPEICPEGTSQGGCFEPRMDTNMRRARARRPAHRSNLRFPSRLRVRKIDISVPDRRFRLNATRAFQPEICPLQLAACGLPLRGGGLPGRGPHAKTRRREGNAGVTLNHEWTRMDTNECSSGFPARDLPSATG